jgi:hypothetical protein
MTEFEKILDEKLFYQDDIGNLNKILDTNIFVISLPKCGTTSIREGFKNLNFRVIHCHINSSTFNNISNGDILKENNWGMEHFVKYRLESKPDEITIFSGFRDPVTWYMSMAFFCNNIPQDSHNFLKNLYSEPPWSTYNFREHFDLIKNITGINIFEYEFDRESGFLILKKDRINLIIYRFDKLKSLETYIKTLFPDFNLPLCRFTIDPRYKEFKNNFKVSIPDFEKLDNDPYTKYFFGNTFREKISEFISSPV